MLLCRICVHEIDEKAIPLFCENEESKEIIKKIFLCSQVNLRKAQSFLNYICSNCLNELNIAFHFRLKCFNSELNLEHILEQTKLDNKSDDRIDKMACSNIFEETSRFDEEQDDPPTQTKEVSLQLSSLISDKILSAKTKTFKCDICNKILKTETSLCHHKIKMHQNRRHVGNVTSFGANRRYNCSKCNYTTPHSQTLVNHVHKHTGERPHLCHCGKRFTQSSALTAHKKIHSDMTFYTCSVCGKQFKHAFGLKKHLVVHEKGSYVCMMCKKVLKSKETLQDHMYRHNNIRNYNCEECGDTFVTSSELINHRKKHNLEKKLECHLCGYKTHTKKLLVLHIKRHTGDKAYRCEKCGVSFITLSELRVHRRVHTREKPYACPTCSQRFMHSPSVNKHMRNVHGIKYKWGEFKHTFINQIKQHL